MTKHLVLTQSKSLFIPQDPWTLPLSIISEQQKLCLLQMLRLVPKQIQDNVYLAHYQDSVIYTNPSMLVCAADRLTSLVISHKPWTSHEGEI